MVQGKGRDGGSGFFEKLEVDNPTAWHSAQCTGEQENVKEKKDTLVFMHVRIWYAPYVPPGPALLSALEGVSLLVCISGSVGACFACS